MSSSSSCPATPIAAPAFILTQPPLFLWAPASFNMATSQASSSSSAFTPPPPYLPYSRSSSSSSSSSALRPLPTSVRMTVTPPPPQPPQTPPPPSSSSSSSSSPSNDSHSKKQRQPWPVLRFLQNATFFTPLGRLLNGPAPPAPQLTTTKKTTTTTTTPTNTTTTTAPAATFTFANMKKSRTVLVVGATGGVGKRVVRELIKLNERAATTSSTTTTTTHIRLLVRNVEAANKIWSQVQDLKLPDLDLLIANDNKPSPSTQQAPAVTIKIYVGDLYNVHPDCLQDVDQLVICTGVKVGPSDDTPQRDKYYQGTKFFPPVILEDTPENVEYQGIKNIVEAFAKVAATNNSLSPADLQHSSSSTPANPDLSRPFLEFSNIKAAKVLWGQVDDVVMGGVSESSIQFIPQSNPQHNYAVFQGTVSTSNNGGFASVRTLPFATPLDLSAFDGIALTLRKGGGNRYKINIRCDDKWDGNAYVAMVDTDKFSDTLWSTVYIPFANFVPCFRAKSNPSAGPIDRKSIRAVQIMLSKFEYDGRLNPRFNPGFFELDIQSLAAYSSGSSLMQPASPSAAAASSDRLVPQVVYVGSAGVTRPLRLDEFPDLSTQPPAVRMNAMLGRILEWKLAGEDAIRASGLRYTIVRPCALTEMPPVGFDHLVVSTGDNLTGQISRNDLAVVLVKALDDPRMSNKTYEIAQSKEITVAQQKQKENGEPTNPTVTSPKHDDIDWDSLVAQLPADDSFQKRPYAPFPYIPQ